MSSNYINVVIVHAFVVVGLSEEADSEAPGARADTWQNDPAGACIPPPVRLLLPLPLPASFYSQRLANSGLKLHPEPLSTIAAILCGLC